MYTMCVVCVLGGQNGQKEVGIKREREKIKYGMKKRSKYNRDLN